MAAFSSSYQYYPFLFDSALMLSNNNINTTTSPAFLHHHHETSFFDNNNNNNNVTNNNNNYLQDQTVSISCVDQSSKVSIISDNEPSVSKNLSPQSSMVGDKLETGDEQVTQKVMTPMGRKRRIRHRSSLSNPQSKDATEEKSKKKRKSNNGVDGVKEEEEEKGKKAEKKKKSSEEPPTGYIHVRARRGQATDSHSLAERVRREKISERMKMLQRLVPGCDKVTGKALMLDEIINYVQSLQNQVEFLSLKLASVNPIFYDLASDIDTFLVRPQKTNSSITSPTPAISVPPHCSTTFADTITTTMTTTPTTATTIFPQTNDYVLDSSASIFLQGQRSNNVFSEDNESHFWVAEDQRQKLLHPYGFINNLCSFH